MRISAPAPFAGSATAALKAGMTLEGHMAKDPTSGEGKSFSQDEMDRIVQQRLAEERKKYSDYDDLRAKAAKVDETEAASKTEADKINERLVAAEQRAEEAEQRSLRQEVALEKGLTARQAARLKGVSLDELLADADDLLDTFAPADGTPSSKAGASDDTTAPKQPPPSRRPKEDLKGGNNSTEADPVDVKKLIESIPPTA